MTVDAVSVSTQLPRRSSVQKMSIRNSAFERLPDEIIEQ
jgi:hypothetical protein